MDVCRTPQTEQNVNILHVMGFAELSITSNFSFLTGGSHPEEYMQLAALQGTRAIVIADENSVAGIVRAHTAMNEIARDVRLYDEQSLGPPRPDHIPAAACSAPIPNPPSRARSLAGVSSARRRRI